MPESKSRGYICFLVIFILISGCEIINLNQETDQFFEKAQKLKVVTLAKGHYANYDIEEKVIIIRDKKEFRELWSNINANRHPLPAMPDVDFGKNMVIVSIMGTRSSGGYVTEIAKAGILDKKLGIKILLTSPGDGCGVTGALTNPYHITKIKNSSFPATFFKENTSRDCAE